MRSALPTQHPRRLCRSKKKAPRKEGLVGTGPSERACSGVVLQRSSYRQIPPRRRRKLANFKGVLRLEERELVLRHKEAQCRCGHGRFFDGGNVQQRQLVVVACIVQRIGTGNRHAACAERCMRARICSLRMHQRTGRSPIRQSRFPHQALDAWPEHTSDRGIKERAQRRTMRRGNLSKSAGPALTVRTCLMMG